MLEIVLRVIQDQEQQLKIVTSERDNARHHITFLQQQLDLHQNEAIQALEELHTLRWMLYQLASGHTKNVISKH
jgi:hypothetical protein